MFENKDERKWRKMKNVRKDNNIRIAEGDFLFLFSISEELF